jgi:hypothetical protein
LSVPRPFSISPRRSLTRRRFCLVSSRRRSASFFRALKRVMPAASSSSARRSSGFEVTMSPTRPCSTIEYALVPAPEPRNRLVTSIRRTGVLLIRYSLLPSRVSLRVTAISA